jgi:hypothetical protein
MEVSGQLHVPAASPQGKSPWYHWIGGWVGPRTSLDAVVKRKIPSPSRDSLHTKLYTYMNYEQFLKGMIYSFLSFATDETSSIMLFASYGSC